MKISLNLNLNFNLNLPLKHNVEEMWLFTQHTASLWSHEWIWIIITTLLSYGVVQGFLAIC